MLLTLIKYFRGYLYVRLTGYAPERFLNLCGSHDILIWNLKSYEDGYEFCISVDGFRKLKPILKKTRTKIKILEKKGLPFCIYHYRKRKVFCIGIFLFAVFLYLLSGFLWNIEINGNSHLSEEMILDFLKEEQASYGAKIKEIDCAALEEKLRSRYTDVIWTSIKIYGTKMTIDIQESLLPEDEYQKDNTTVFDIAAAADGRIKKMITRSGTPLVKANDKVKKGDILVSGQVEILNDDGVVSKYLSHSADADIYAVVNYTYQDIIKGAYLDKKFIGEPKINYGIRFFDFRISNPFFKTDKNTDYEVLTEAKQFHFTEHFYLPIYLEKKTYQAYKEAEKIYTKEQLKTLAEKNLKNYLTELEEKGIQIIEKNVMIVKTKQNYVVKGTITAYQSIVSYVPTEVPDITSEERQTTDESD